jgi:hypothetical protein
MRHRLLLALALVAVSLTSAPSAFARGDGFDFGDEVQGKKESQRTGHAAYTPAQLKEGLGRLSPAQRAAYDAIVAKLDATTRAQLEALVAKHRVQYKDATGKTVLDNLKQVATRPLGHGIANAELLRETIRDICRPSTIAQAAHSTCTATSIQSALARSAPGEYTRVVAGLAMGDGEVTLRDGQMRISSSNFIPFDDRTVSSNLMQPAIMDAEARLNGGRYDNRTDTTVIRRTGQKYKGAGDSDVSTVETAILAGRYETLTADDTDKSRLLSILKAATPRQPVLASFNTEGGGGHEFQVVGYDRGKKAFVVRNPWGEVDFISVRDFERYLDGVNHRVDD